ncbi:MAG: hypothetical protein GF400_09555 [Candidatus Eisenbacteria bacterium]|nr:hypothetical protein [Candidatus Eisenbacteria bacterium]
MMSRETRRKGMKHSILAVALLAVFALSASAYDFLYTGDTAITHDMGAFGIRGEFVYLSADGAYDSEGEKVDWPDDTKFTQTAVPVEIYYSVMDNLEIGVQPKFLSRKYEYSYVDPADTTQMVTCECDGTGIGDTWLWAKYMFMPEPLMTARLGVKVATGDDEPGDMEYPLGTGQMDVDGAIMLGAPAGPGMFEVAIGYRYRMARGAETTVESDGGEEVTYEDYKYGDEIHFAAMYTYYLNDAMNLRIGADGFFGSDHQYEDATTDGLEEIAESAMNAVWINPGFDYLMENGMTLGIDVHYPLMGQNVNALWGAGAYVSWGSM